jgi:tyrosyl-tRNA synthetase
LVGGFTAKIGDPTGKTEQRQALEQEQVDLFSGLVEGDLRRYLGEEVLFVNNREWLDCLTFQDYLKFAFKISVNQKLCQETYRTRLGLEECCKDMGSKNNGISMGEFCYGDIQAYDFCVLNERYGCIGQVGGQDQWGNICFGVHTVGARDSKAFGICTPLWEVGGQKLSKTGMCPLLREPEKLYDFCLNLPDRSAIEILWVLSGKEVSEGLEAKHELLRLVIGRFFGDDTYERTHEKIKRIREGKPESSDLIQVRNKKLSKILLEIGFVSSVVEAKLKIKESLIRVDYEEVSQDRVFDSGVFRIELGKKKIGMVQV